MARRPQLSLSLSTFSAEDPGGWAHLREQIVVADTVGIDRVVMSDHVVFGDDLSAYGDPSAGGQAGGRQPTGPDGHWLEPSTVMSWGAGFTEHVRFSTNILLAALRRPVVLAKQLATLDVLSGGRIDVGVGVGWQRAEYDAAGLDYERRGALLDHTLSVCAELWRDGAASVDDEFLQFERIHQMPSPTRTAGVPIWVAGTVNPRMLRRLARFGSGWIPWGPAAEDPAAHIVEVKRALEKLGRDDVDELEVTARLPIVEHEGVLDVAATIAAARPLVTAGVTDLRTRWTSPRRPEDDRARLAELVGALRDSF